MREFPAANEEWEARMKPSEFHIGVTDLFSILVPGAIFTAIVLWLLPASGGSLPIPWNDQIAPWVAFVVASYFSGHLIYGFGSLLDHQRIYEKYRRRTWPDSKSAFPALTRPKNKMLQQDVDAFFNNYKWAKSVLMTKAPLGLSEVNRLEADSKFFRSAVVLFGLVGTGALILVIVKLVLIVIGVSGRPSALGVAWWMLVSVFAVAVLLAILSFLRYAAIRHKGSELACMYALVVLAAGTKEEPKKDE